MAACLRYAVLSFNATWVLSTFVDMNGETVELQPQVDPAAADMGHLVLGSRAEVADEEAVQVLMDLALRADSSNR